MHHFKKRMEESESLFKSPRDKKEECARRGCLFITGLFIAGTVVLIVYFYLIQKKLQDRDYCRAAEYDAHVIAATIADYFAIPSHTSLGSLPIVVGPGPSTRNGIDFPALSGKNNGQINGDINEISISVSDASGRCLMSYQETTPSWNGIAGKGVFTKILK
ncbi:MAG: hypothetical protein D3925_04985 [Candidatus Electrothrix sp. AR5]|nr:hypothetical protein [Candidatus Electrothrix sp. AR5]